MVSCCPDRSWISPAWLRISAGADARSRVWDVGVARRGLPLRYQSDFPHMPRRKETGKPLFSSVYRSGFSAPATASSPGEAPPGPFEGTPAPAGQEEPRPHGLVAAGWCSQGDLESVGTDLNTITTDLRGVKRPPENLRPPFKDRPRTGSAGEPEARAFRLQK